MNSLICIQRGRKSAPSGGQVLGDGRTPVPTPPATGAAVAAMPNELQQKIDEILRDSNLQFDGVFSRAEETLSEAMATAVSPNTDVAALGLSYLQKAFKVYIVVIISLLALNENVGRP